MKDDVIAHLSDQLIALTARLDSLENTNAFISDPSTMSKYIHQRLDAIPSPNAASVIDSTVHL
ncbi:MAG: hypothetical protein WA323_05725 [Candidatus Nitrosopolaris sp.]